MGFKWEDVADQFVVEAWPDTADAISVFISMVSQWRWTNGQRVGLDYNCLPDVMRMRGIPRSEWPGVFDSVRVMEDAALTVIRKQ